MSRSFVFLLTVLCLACHGGQHITSNSTDEFAYTSIDSNSVPMRQEPETDEFSESFTNDLTIGRARKNKVEINCFRTSEHESVVIKFYSRTESNDWNLKQSLQFEKLGGPTCDPRYEDFNNDRRNDLTFISGTAARGANEIRTLLIYDKKRDELVHIKNSEEYPNLEYNSRLNCIDSWIITAATTTVFLRLKGDVLQEFASVDEGEQITASVVDSNGNSRIIRRLKRKDINEFNRYRNFDPIEP